MYAGVEFDKTKECAVVPFIWTRENKKCYWPNLNNKISFDNLVKQCSPPKSYWRMYDIKKVYFTTENWDEANELLNSIIQEAASEAVSSGDNDRLLTKKFITSTSENANEMNSFSQNNMFSQKSAVSPGGSIPCPSTSTSSGTHSISQNLLNATSFSSNFADHFLPTNEPEVLYTESRESREQSSSVRSGGSTNSSETNFSSRSNRFHSNFEEQITRTLETISEEVEQNSLRTQQILRLLSQNETTNLVKPDDFPKFPITKSKKFKELEKILKEETAFNYLKHRLASLGGTSVRHATTSMLKYIFTNKCAKKFNWAGNNNKKPFKDTKCMGAIQEAVFMHFTVEKPADLDFLNIKKAVQDWLRLASQRHSYQLSKHTVTQE